LLSIHLVGILPNIAPGLLIVRLLMRSLILNLTVDPIAEGRINGAITGG
jgi:hypothetical protein